MTLSPSPSNAQAPLPAQDQGIRRVTDAYVAFFPLYEMARLRHIAVEEPANPRRAPVNKLVHLRRLLDHTDRTVTAPNNDTLYSTARLDLRLGPVVIDTPVMAQRYYSLHFMNMYTDNVAILGQRVGGQGPLKVVVVGPGWTGAIPEHTHRVNSDTHDMWLLVRTLVDGPNDIPAVAALQDAMRLSAPQAPSAYPAMRLRPVKDPGPEAFVNVLGEMLERNPPQGAMAVRLKQAEALGLGPGKSWQQLSADQQSLWQQAWPSASASLLQIPPGGPRRVSGWQYPVANIGQWGDNMLLRATVALRGIAALDSAETLYMSTVQDLQGEPLSGAKRYRVRIPPGGLPVAGFWSLTVYEALPDGRFFLTPNPLARYAIGNRTQGLPIEADGSIDMLLQHEAPADRRRWLPAPPGPIRLSLRAYLPSAALVAGEVPLPIIEVLKD